MNKLLSVIIIFITPLNTVLAQHEGNQYAKAQKEINIVYQKILSGYSTDKEFKGVSAALDTISGCRNKSQVSQSNPWLLWKCLSHLCFRFKNTAHQRKNQNVESMADRYSAGRCLLWICQDKEMIMNLSPYLF